MNNIPLTNSRDLFFSIIVYNFSHKLVFRNFSTSSEQLFVFCRSTVVESCCQFALSHFPHFINQVLFNRFKFLRTFQIGIDSCLVTVRYCGYIVYRLHSTFDFQTVHTIFNHIRYVINHGHIYRRHRKFFWDFTLQALSFLAKRHIIKVVFPTTRLRATTTVSITHTHVVRKCTAS